MDKKINSLWINMAVDARFSWTNKTVKIHFEGYQLHILPVTESSITSISLLANHQLTMDEGASLLSRFLSKLAWQENRGAKPLYFNGTNMPNQPGLLGGRAGNSSSWIPDSPRSQLFITSTQQLEQDLALALYREGMCSSFPLYTQLCYFKILNILLKNGTEHKEWFIKNIPVLQAKNHFFNLEIIEIETNGLDLSNHFWKNRRCAIAHAFAPPVVNPDDVQTVRRLDKESSVLKELAQHFMINELKIKSEDQAREQDSKSSDGEYFLLSPEDKSLYVPAGLFREQSRKLWLIP